MSLKEFHKIFIISSIILLIMFGFWSLNHAGQTDSLGYFITAMGSFFAGVGLSVYLLTYIKKLQC